MKNYLIALLIIGIYTSCKPTKVITPEYVSKAYIDSAANTQWKNNGTFVAAQNPISLQLPNGKILWLPSNICNNYFNGSNTNININNIDYSGNAYLQNGTNWQNLNKEFGVTSSGDFFKVKSSYVFGDSIYVRGSGFGIDCYVFAYRLSTMQETTKRIFNPAIAQGGDKIVSFTLGNALDTLSGFTYEYGYDYDRKYFLARHSIDDINKKWQFFQANNWIDSINSNAKPIYWDPTLELIKVVKIKNYFVALSINKGHYCSTPTSIFTSYSSTPEGPFVGARKMYTVPTKFNNAFANVSDIDMNAYTIKDGTIQIAYSINDFSNCTTANNFNSGIDAKYVTSYFIRVPLHEINESW